MSEKDEVTAPVKDASVLDAAELAPTQAQTKEIAEGCIANSLLRYPQDKKDGFKKAVAGAENDLSVAIDRIRKRRSSMSVQLERLQAKKKEIGGGDSTISALYVFAEPAISSCPTAANAARVAKEGSDIVHARLNEVEYQMALIQANDLILASEERELSSAMTGLDEMVLALG